MKYKLILLNSIYTTMFTATCTVCIDTLALQKLLYFQMFTGGPEATKLFRTISESIVFSNENHH